MDWLRETPNDRYRPVVGTLAFVDLSGFTKMCERLARKGRVGAEEASDILDLCFTHLLSVAYEYGGGVIKWGGDAVLLLFDEEDHAARACRAAFGMRRELRRFSRLRTSAGLVSLRMSVGIHSGSFDFFLVGRSHRELVIAGPDASRTVAMEQIAGPGEIALSPETASLLSPLVVGRRKEEAFLLKGEPEAEVRRSRPVTSADVQGLDLAGCVHAVIRDYLVAGGGDTEHRHVAVAFVQFTGTDELLASGGPEAAAEALDEVVSAIQEAVDEHAVSFHETDVDKNGGKILLVAGAPMASGNDEERMLRALRAIVSRPHALPVRIGVNNGHVFTGNFGPPYRRTYSIKGDVVNLAARVMAKAQPGQILVTPSVLERSATVFQTESIEPFLAKGKKHPVNASALGDVIGSRRAPGPSDFPFVGREREIAVLEEGLRGIEEGSGALVQLVGEPGIGKSRLVDELSARAGSTTLFRVACDPYGSSTPYQSFRPMLRELAGIPPDADAARGGRILARRVAEAVPDLLPWLPLVAVPMYVDVPSTPQTEQLELQFKKVRVEEVTERFLSAMLPGPSILIFEDVHWMDEASSDLLKRIGQDVGQRPWLLCVSRRDQGAGFVPPRSDATFTLVLSPLPAEAAVSLAKAATEEAPLTPHQLSLLTERSGGNPLFLRELLAASRTSSGVEGLPATVEALLAAQIDKLAAPDRALLRYASVLGANFQGHLLREVLPRERSASLEDAAVWRRLAEFLSREKGDVVRFRHALIRDAAYEGLPYRRRQEIHARVGEVIERTAGPTAEEQAELLSLHFFQAGAYDRAWAYSRLAGERAQSKFANVEAADFYRRALESARRLGGIDARALVRVHQSLGDVSERTGMYEQAGAAYRAARGLVKEDAVARARLLLKQGLLHERAGRHTSALTWYGRGLRALEQAPPGREALTVRAQLSVWYASSRRGQGRHDECIRWCLRAIEDGKESGEMDAVAHAYRLLDWVYTAMGSPLAATYRDLALPIYEQLGDLAGQSEVLNNLGMDAYFEGRWDEAVDLYRRSTEARQKTGDAVNAMHGVNNIAEILSDQGHLEEAATMFREALSVWKAAGYRWAAAGVSNLGRIAARSGNHEKAMRLYVEALGGFLSKQAEAEALETQARMAEALLLAGKPTEAVDIVDRTLRDVEELGGLAVLGAMLQRLLGCALISEDLGRARGALLESLRLARSVNAEYEAGQTLVALAGLARLCGEREAEEAYRNEAQVILDRLGVVSLAEIPVPVPVPPLITELSKLER
jgi:class 3 adenylate cyclase/tetratricopeptide (TPR) repeat protein